METTIKQNNIIIAGVPRSGSTLVCHLLNKIPNTVALHEPINPHLLEGQTLENKLDKIESFFLEQRELINTKGVAVSKSFKGKVPDNPMSGYDSSTNKRTRVLDGNEIEINKPLSENFILAIKQPGMFTGMLGGLQGRYRCYATIRNPLSVLLSWNSLEMPVSNGRAPAAEACDKNLSIALDNEANIYKRQTILLAWYFNKISDFIAPINIIRYEDTVKNGGKNLSVINSQADDLTDILTSRNSNSLYDMNKKDLLIDCLLTAGGDYLKFYNENDIETLI